MDYPGLFKRLDDVEEMEFREYARIHDPENLDNWDIYHPVCRNEWAKRGIHPLRRWTDTHIYDRRKK